MQRDCVGVSMVTLLQRLNSGSHGQPSSGHSLSSNNVNMDRTCQVLKTEQKKHPPSRRAVLSNKWDSAESDTESLAQERAYQQELQMCIDRNKYLVHQKQNTHVQQWDREDEDSTDDETEEIQVYDSLEVEAHPQANGSRSPALTKHMHSQINEQAATSRLLSEEADSDWRSRLNAAGDSTERPQTERCGGQWVIVDTSPAAVVTPHVTGKQSDQPCYLHPQHGPNPGSPSPSSSDGAKHESEGKTYHQETPGGPTGAQHTSTSKVSWHKKLERLKEDIVERNKVTLGRNNSKGGSYLTAYALKQGAPHNVNQAHETLEERDSKESQVDSSDPKLRVSQNSKGKKAHRKKHPSPPQNMQPPAPVAAELQDCLSSPLARPAAEPQPKPPKTTSSGPLPPAVNPNGHLKASADVLPLLQQTGQEAVTNLHSPLCPRRSPEREAELVSPSGYQQTHLGASVQRHRKGLNTQLHHLESSPNQWQRTTALNCPLYCEEEDNKWSPNELHNKQFPPTATSPLGSGSFTVLPPIGQPGTGDKAKLSANTARRSSSDGYLAQMDKQKQMKARVTYKAYSLKDYKQLNTDINLRGLGPDYKAIEKTKMNRQRLYSNVIREQNKKNISRILFLPSTDRQGTDKTDPRMKALEYAKTIAKPHIQPQHKDGNKPQSRGFTETHPYLNDSDISQQATLEVLKKRHEEEKKAVARFRKGHDL